MPSWHPGGWSRDPPSGPDPWRTGDTGRLGRQSRTGAVGGRRRPAPGRALGGAGRPLGGGPGRGPAGCPERPVPAHSRVPVGRLPRPGCLAALRPRAAAGGRARNSGWRWRRPSWSRSPCTCPGPAAATRPGSPGPPCPLGTGPSGSRRWCSASAERPIPCRPGDPYASCGSGAGPPWRSGRPCGIPRRSRTPPLRTSLWYGLLLWRGLPGPGGQPALTGSSCATPSCCSTRPTWAPWWACWRVWMATWASCCSRVPRAQPGWS